MRVKNTRQSTRRLGAAFTVVALAAAGLGSISPAASADGTGNLSAADSQPTATTTFSADKAPSSGLARTPAGLKKITSAKAIPVMIKYDYDAVASYSGNVRGYAATSPSVTDKRLTSKRVAASPYTEYVKGRERAISARIAKAVPTARIRNSYRVVYGGVAATIPGNSVKAVLKVPGVVAVQRDTLNHTLTDSSTRFVNAQRAYRALHTRRNAGQGVLLGNLDSGVWPEHPSFADQGNLPDYTGTPLDCNFGDNPLTPAVDVFECNNKLVGGAMFTDGYNALVGDTYLYADTARDADGHGSHTSSTSAGNVVTGVQTIGPLLSEINGMAPGAQVMEYRVCGPDGCFGSDTTAAVGQAILDGVDVINYSISGGSDPLTDATELAFLDAYNAGIFVAASAGNSGPGASTTDHLSPWVTTVAASTQTREFASDLTLTADDSTTFEVSGASLTAGAGPLPIVMAADEPAYTGGKNCLAEAAPGIFVGKIVVCERGGGGLGRVSKGYNVAQGGAAGMILYNPVLADTETDNHWLPAVHVADGTDMLAFIAAHTGITATFTAGAARDGQGDVMAAFSSRGPGGLFIKPDITAPGVQILAAHTPTPESVTGGPPGQYYQAIAGTSMSSPHVAGAALLVRAVHPDWTPGQIKSALMTRAKTAVVKEDLTTPADAFDMGAGRLDVGRAINAPLTISDSSDNMFALTADPLHAIDLNIPSINAPVMPGRVSTVRTVQNVTNRTLTVKARASAPADTRFTLSPKSAVVPPGGSAAFRITIDSTAPVGSQQFATVSFVTSKGTAHVPVAFVPQQGSVSLSQSCAAPSVVLGLSTTCNVTAVNNGFEEQQVDLTTTTNSNLRVTGASGATLTNGRATTTATLAGASLGVPTVDPGASPAGYLPLSLFGIPSDPVGDEDLRNFNVPEFMYNGQPETAIGVTSNGYLVVGGGTSADVSFDPPPGPSSALPNDVLAPFWTDLDGTGAQGIAVATLTDGVNTWLVVEWNVNVWGTTDGRTFQAWIGVNGVQDISYAYDPSALPADPNGQTFLVGAENASGLGDMEAVLPTEDLVVTSTDPTPGDVLTYQVTVKGIKRGAGNVHTEMVAPGLVGTTIANTPLSVTRPPGD